MVRHQRRPPDGVRWGARRGLHHPRPCYPGHVRGSRIQSGGRGGLQPLQAQPVPELRHLHRVRGRVLLRVQGRDHRQHLPDQGPLRPHKPVQERRHLHVRRREGEVRVRQRLDRLALQDPSRGPVQPQPVPELRDLQQQQQRRLLPMRHGLDWDPVPDPGGPLRNEPVQERRHLRDGQRQGQLHLRGGVCGEAVRDVRRLLPQSVSERRQVLRRRGRHPRLQLHCRLQRGDVRHLRPLPRQRLQEQRHVHSGQRPGQLHLQRGVDRPPLQRQRPVHPQPVQQQRRVPRRPREHRLPLQLPGGLGGAGLQSAEAGHRSVPLSLALRNPKAQPRRFAQYAAVGHLASGPVAIVVGGRQTADVVRGGGAPGRGVPPLRSDRISVCPGPRGPQAVACAARAPRSARPALRLASAVPQVVAGGAADGAAVPVSDAAPSAPSRADPALSHGRVEAWTGPFCGSAPAPPPPEPAYSGWAEAGCPGGGGWGGGQKTI
mmetsp:Transcript_73372/g.123570  ORF Transcript_73372/g.123570 Transcript_73372/m.123570 type:complete len:489 (-) Transcript_73372:8-1474(-)